MAGNTLPQKSSLFTDPHKVFLTLHILFIITTVTGMMRTDTQQNVLMSRLLVSPQGLGGIRLPACGGGFSVVAQQVLHSVQSCRK